jgi:prophage DNA circulation protein
VTRDVWADELSTASYGGVDLDVLATADTIARALVQHSYPRKDGGDLVDFGAAPRVTECRICFFEREPEREDTSRLNHLQRYAAFCAVVARGTPQTFVHPITGRYQALVENLYSEASGDNPNSIDVTCTFVEDTTTPATFDGGNGRPIDAGAAAVATEGALLDAYPDGPPGLGASVADTVSSWDSASSTVREVNAEIGAISSTIDDALDSYDLATDPSKYPIYRSLQRLHYSARRAADRFREAQPRIYEITLTVPKPLRVLVAENYGADDLERRLREILDLNDVDDPTLIAAGTTLRVPARTTSERAGR